MRCRILLSAVLLVAASELWACDYQIRAALSESSSHSITFELTNISNGSITLSSVDLPWIESSMLVTSLVFAKSHLSPERVYGGGDNLIAHPKRVVAEGDSLKGSVDIRDLFDIAPGESMSRGVFFWYWPMKKTETCNHGGWVLVGGDERGKAGS